MLRVLAVDLGATSARVAAVDLDARPPAIEIVHRHPHRPVTAADGSLRWDWDGLVAEVRRGLEIGAAAGPVASIGIDTWGVDYGLLDRTGQLVGLPYSHRDARTDGWTEVVERIGASRLYAVTGIQLMRVNTVFQLAVHDRRELDGATRLLMLPELTVHALSGVVTGERTSAGTTGLVDALRQEWSADLVGAIGIDPAILPPLAAAGTPAGEWRGVPIHLVGGHDTASAVAALPGEPLPGAAFVSSGTWLLVGAERRAPDTSDAALRANFSNEPGVCGGVRFLKNVMGFWLLEQCRASWDNPPVAELLGAAEAAPPGGPVIDATDERFLAPADMEEEIRAAAGGGLPPSAGRDRVVRCILDSLAVATARVVDELGDFLGAPVPELHVLGGGARTPFVHHLLEEACQVPVRVGPVEATALGNALVQGIALGRFSDLTEARRALV